jgi:microcystin-dependent protein
MATPFVGEIRIFAGNFAPRGYAFCNGQLLPISQNQALFSLIGTFYGGDGKATFALPDLRGRVPIHMGQGPGLSPYVQGQLGGAENVTLLSTQIPAHSHPVNAIAAGGNSASPSGSLPAIESTGTSLDYSSGGANATMSSAMIGGNSGGQPHSNIQPYLTVNFIIALQGVFPSRN